MHLWCSACNRPTTNALNDDDDDDDNDDDDDDDDDNDDDNDDDDDDGDDDDDDDDDDNDDGDDDDGSDCAAFGNLCTMFCSVVGGMAEWLGRRSLAGGVSLTCTRSVVDRWLLWINCPLWVIQLGQLSLPFLWGR